MSSLLFERGGSSVRRNPDHRALVLLEDLFDDPDDFEWGDYDYVPPQPVKILKSASATSVKESSSETLSSDQPGDWWQGETSRTSQPIVTVRVGFDIGDCVKCDGKTGTIIHSGWDADWEVQFEDGSCVQANEDRLFNLTLSAQNPHPVDGGQATRDNDAPGERRGNAKSPSPALSDACELIFDVKPSQAEDHERTRDAVPTESRFQPGDIVKFRGRTGRIVGPSSVPVWEIILDDNASYITAEVELLPAEYECNAERESGGDTHEETDTSLPPLASPALEEEHVPSVSSVQSSPSDDESRDFIANIVLGALVALIVLLIAGVFLS